MKTEKISPDDPRLTAYALGEMEPAERTEFELLLRDDPEARAAVDGLRATAQALGAALETEPVPTPVKAEVDPYLAGRKVLRFPQLYFVISGLAAACFAVMFVVWQQRHPESEHARKQYVQVNLPQADAVKRAEVAAAAKVAAAPVALPTVAADQEPREQEAKAGSAVAEEKVVVLEPFSVAVAPRVTGTAPAAVGALLATNEPANRDSAGAAQPRGNVVDETEVKYKSATAVPSQVAGAALGGKDRGLIGRPAAPEFNTEAYGRVDENPFQAVAQQPQSTFSIDVDTAAYANVRRFLTQKRRPPRDAVRIEEMVNYFPYRYAPPAAGGAPFAASLEVAAAPWAPGHRLVRIGLKGREVSEAARPAANLVFLVDVSGSMDEPNKLPLVKQSLRLLVNRLRPDDRVGIVVYAGASGLALPSTAAAQKARILNAIDALEPGGSTNGEAGIQLAYDLAKANFIAGGINRVILATDGDFNVGPTSEGELTRLVEEKAKSGVFLTVLGFGMGNFKDEMLVKLADKGNGNYAYIDTAAEARKALVEQAGGTLVTIAQDVKIQVEFNPAQVQAYRLIGYEKRMLRTEDFNHDQVDAGEIGAGHTVTALYEVVPVGATAPDTGRVDPLKYQPVREPLGRTVSGELLTVKVRYKEPAGEVSRKVEFPLRDDRQEFAQASADFKFSAAVAAFGMILRDSPYKGAATLADVAAWARAGTDEDAGGYRAEFLQLINLAGETSQ